MVTFVSQCEKKALNRTRRVLDAFADRIGDNTWQTVITQEGLLAVKKLLRKTATKNTAVSCHWIRSRSRTELVWVVGNKDKFNAQGIVPVNMTSMDQQVHEDFSLNKEVIALLAQISGLFHDVGKAMRLFQEKLNHSLQGIKGKSYEPYRHEWVSLRIFQAFVNDQTDEEWLTSLKNINDSFEEKMLLSLVGLRDGIDKNIENPLENLPPVAKLVAWLIVSHHKLPQYPKGGDNPPSLLEIDRWINDKFEACWNSPQCLQNDWQQEVIQQNWDFPEGTPFKSAHWQTKASLVAEKALCCVRLFNEDWFNQRFTSHLARLSLMLADHYYSSEKETSKIWRDRNYHAYANTDVDENGNKYLKQKLDEHNIAVSENARQIAYVLPRLKRNLPALRSNKALGKKVPEKYQSDFGWQDSAYQLAQSLRENTKEYGFFGICQASTGKGKTRGNARIMYGLSDEEECRFNVALGLRTLTLQTADSLKRDLKIADDELSLLVGSQAMRDLHQQNREPETSDKQELGSESAESLLKDEMTLVQNLPDYYGEGAEWFKHDPKILKLIQSPVLVSTIDYLMPANEGIRGGRQIAPMLRLLTSDLVLDEPDDFGLADLPALCRLVNWAGLLGSRVLLSTATISPSLASALFASYQAGRLHYTQVNGQHGEQRQICCAWFDEFKKPKSEMITDISSYESSHNEFVTKRIDRLEKANRPLRKAKLISIDRDLDKTPIQCLATVVVASMHELHSQHYVNIADKKVSIGLVRMANIDPLIATAKYLLQASVSEDTVVHYCIYHSQFPLLQRSKIEKQLDGALSRKDEKDWLKKSGIPEIVGKHPEHNHIFVVLATAVAEVGRDHDYDWAIVEPSSMRSIIQLAGRVQRHRRQVPSCENIHILSKNLKGLKGQSPCFEKPGFESAKLRYASVDLINITRKGQFGEIDSVPRIKAPEAYSFTEETPPRFTQFEELEHLAQSLRLIGGNNQQDCAAQWWNHEVTWCGELQRLQPFRRSTDDDDFNQSITRKDKIIWQKKIPKTSPPQYQNATEISRQEETLNLAIGNLFWGDFDLREEISELGKRLNLNESTVLKRFTHLSLRKLDEHSDQQWQCHPKLGVYNNLKKDDYE